MRLHSRGTGISKNGPVARARRDPEATSDLPDHGVPEIVEGVLLETDLTVRVGSLEMGDSERFPKTPRILSESPSLRIAAPSDNPLLLYTVLGVRHRLSPDEVRRNLVDPAHMGCPPIARMRPEGARLPRMRHGENLDAVPIEVRVV